MRPAKLLALTAACVLLLSSIPCGIWAALFDVPILAVLCALAAAGAFCLLFRSPAVWVGLSITLLSLALAGVLSPPIVREVDRHVEELSSKPRSAAAPGAFDLRDRLGIWGLNAAMGLAALPFYPEAARETLAMILPAPRNAVRTFSIKARVPMRSERIRAVLAAWSVKLKQSSADTAELTSEQLFWPPGAYSRLGSPEARAALAWNGCTMTARAVRIASAWKVDVAIRERISYPWSSRVTLMRKPDLVIEEGLFRALEEIGWLHPYRAVWNFSVLLEDG
ncbi:MAG: hypothetical protein ACLQDL_03325 [Spirochaetia bacterium]